MSARPMLRSLPASGACPLRIAPCRPREPCVPAGAGVARPDAAPWATVMAEPRPVQLAVVAALARAEPRPAQLAAAMPRASAAPAGYAGAATNRREPDRL